MSDGVEGDNCVELLTFCLLIKIEMERFSVIQKSDRRRGEQGSRQGVDRRRAFDSRVRRSSVERSSSQPSR